jgi:hypothetical protein
MLEHLTQQRLPARLQLALVDRGVTAAAARTLGRNHELEVRRVGWDDKQPVFRHIRHAWRVEVAPGRLSVNPSAGPPTQPCRPGRPRITVIALFASSCRNGN